MSLSQTALRARDDANATVAELLRSRALSISPQWLAGQLLAGVAINAALLAWFPKGWGIATAGLATVLLHSLWSLAVRRTTVPNDVEEFIQEREASAAWWHVRRITAVSSAAAALVLMWLICMFMLGRLIS